MAQNENAYERAVAAGETLFNEAAFKRNRALYEGQLLGHPFRTVVKTFQVRVWRELKSSWRSLPVADQDALQRDYLPAAEAMFDDSAPR